MSTLGPIRRAGGLRGAEAKARLGGAIRAPFPGSVACLSSTGAGIYDAEMLGGAL